MLSDSISMKSQRIPSLAINVGQILKKMYALAKTTKMNNGSLLFLMTKKS